MLHDSDFKEIELGDKEVFDKYIGKLSRRKREDGASGGYPG